MPDDETKNEEEFEGEDDESSEEEPSRKPFPKKMIFIGGGVLVLLILCAVGYLYFAPSIQASDGTGSVTADEQSGQEDGKSDRRSSRSSRRGSDEPAVSTNIFYTEFDSSVVNLGLSEKYDYVYLKYSINLELGDENVRMEISQKLPKLISVVDSVMIGQQWDKISTIRGREALAADVVDTLNDNLETGEVVACHFVTFVAQ